MNNSNLYLIESRYNYYAFNRPVYLSLNSVASFLVVSGIVLIIADIILLAYWIFLDARKRETNPALWGLLGLITNVIGLIIYLMTRPEIRLCVSCARQQQRGFAVCPYCGARNRPNCAGCGTPLEKGWVACPHCGSLIELPAEQ